MRETQAKGGLGRLTLVRNFRMLGMSTGGELHFCWDDDKATANLAKPMSKVIFKRKRGAKFRFSDQERTRLKGVSDAESEVLARTDPENPPSTKQQLDRMALAREVRLVREKTGLSQPQFATRFHIGLARLRDFEQARSEPDFIVRVFLRMILEDPVKADRLIKLVEGQSTAKASGFRARNQAGGA